MGSLFRILMGRPLLRPLARVVVGLIAIPVFRLILQRFVRLQDLDVELEKDLEQWFRASLLLLVATANMEESLFGWVPPLLERITDARSVEPEGVAADARISSLPGTANPDPAEEGSAGNTPVPSAVKKDNEKGDFDWILLGMRILLAIGVVQAMPDQELFSIIHPGPPKLKFDKQRSFFAQLRTQFRPVCKGLICKHMNQSSPVFAILAAIAVGWVGWLCYWLAIMQYLVIGLVTSRARALDVLSVFDRQVAIRRRSLIEEFNLEKSSEHGETPAPTDRSAR